jgi:2',3'-cyclic-nucleotide 2'-phosphodiesterase
LVNPLLSIILNNKFRYANRGFRCLSPKLILKQLNSLCSLADKLHDINYESWNEVKPVRILMLGDLVGRPGRTLCRERLRLWRKEHEIDLVIVNGENASGGNGLTVKNAGELLEAGVDAVTSGNHIWQQKDHEELFTTYPVVIRPANYPDDLPGSGWTIAETSGGVKVGVMNVQGQVFMDPIDSPFRAADKCVDKIRKHTRIIIADIHAEATSEKVAMGIYLDGRVSAVMGTHTHVMSADERILSGGTAYLTDLGMVGPLDGVLGVDSKPILHKFLTGTPARFTVAKGRVIATGAIISIDPSNGKAVNIKRFEEIHEPS